MVLIIHGLTEKNGDSKVHVALEYHSTATVREIRELIAVKPMTIHEIKKRFGLREVPMSLINTDEGIVHEN